MADEAVRRGRGLQVRALRRASSILASTALLGQGVPNAPAADVRLNQIQVIGSHNSYHVAPYPTVRDLIAQAAPGRADEIDYTHRPLAEQFSELRIRQIELDVHADPEGGLYAAPKARALLRATGGDAGPDPNADGALSKPGLKVLHVPDFDYRTTTPTFVEALKQVRAWSKDHPRHVPIMILVELSEEPGASRPVPFDKAGLDAVDAEILSVFDRSEIITPDLVRGDCATLPEAIARQGWPRLDAVRGKVMFALDNEGSILELYLDGRPALRGRPMFASAAPGSPAAAWFKRNDPIRDFDAIQRLVRDGYMVRTRADADTVQARRNDGSMRDKAMASGAQFVSTDYAEPNRKFSSYAVRLPGGVAARANPVSGRSAADAGDLEPARP